MVCKSCGKARQLGKEVLKIAGSPKLARLETRQQRRQICQSCPKKHGSRCGACGCFIGAKIPWAVSECPDKPPKWGPE